MLWFSLVNVPVKTINKSIKMHVVELRVESRELRAESCRELRFDSWELQVEFWGASNRKLTSLAAVCLFNITTNKIPGSLWKKWTGYKETKRRWTTKNNLRMESRKRLSFSWNKYSKQIVQTTFLTFLGSCRSQQDRPLHLWHGWIRTSCEQPSCRKGLWTNSLQSRWW